MLLLRAALGVTALIEGLKVLFEPFDLSGWTLFVGIGVIICGASILLGFLTPVVVALLFAASLFNALFLYPASLQTLPEIYGIILSAAVILLGPGAFSVDAALFGRREIFIPKN